MSTPRIPPGYVRARRGLILPGDLIHRRGYWSEAIYEPCMEGTSIETLRPDVVIARPPGCCVRCGEPGGRFKSSGLCYACEFPENKELCDRE